MKPEEYVKTIIVYDKMVNVGIDDYGQCYFIEYLDESTGELVEISCGTYENDYEGFAKSMIDHRRFLFEIYGEEWVLEMERKREERMEKYRRENPDDETNI